MGSIPGQGTKIPHATQQGQKINKNNLKKKRNKQCCRTTILQKQTNKQKKKPQHIHGNRSDLWLPQVRQKVGRGALG